MEEQWTSSVLSPPANDRLGDIYLDLTSKTAKLSNSMNYEGTYWANKIRILSNLNYSCAILKSHDASSMIP